VFQVLPGSGPNNIESISCWRAWVHCIVCEQGKKGVILVTTKNGSTKKKDFEITISNRSPNKLLRYLSFRTTTEWISKQFWAFLQYWGPHLKMEPAGCLSPDHSASVLTVQRPIADRCVSAIRDRVHSILTKPTTISRIFFSRTGVISTTSLNVGAVHWEVTYNATLVALWEELYPWQWLTKINAGWVSPPIYSNYQ